MTPRFDYDLIASWIPQGARVLDLGCGDGELLARLAATRGVKGYGVEIDPARVLAAVGHGVSVIQSNLESGLSGFESRSFDYVILSQTLQAVRHTRGLQHGFLRCDGAVIAIGDDHQRHDASPWMARCAAARGRRRIRRPRLRRVARSGRG